MSQNVAKLYRGVIDDVINTMREAFNEDGIDEQVLLDLKTTWERRLAESKAVDCKEPDAATSSGSSAGPARGRGSAAANRAAAALQQQQLTAELAHVVQNTAAPQLNPFQAQLAQNAIRPNDVVVQLDGPHDTSDEEEEDEDGKDNDEDHDDNDDDKNEEENDSPGEDEEPLNSEDDVSDEEPNELFETDNVVVCQYDKITRSRNKWKFHLKDGVMNLTGKDYVFQKAVGDAEW